MQQKSTNQTLNKKMDFLVNLMIVSYLSKYNLESNMLRYKTNKENIEKLTAGIRNVQRQIREMQLKRKWM